MMLRKKKRNMYILKFIWVYNQHKIYVYCCSCSKGIGGKKSSSLKNRTKQLKKGKTIKNSTTATKN